jgi:hypothetical protein
MELAAHLDEHRVDMLVVAHDGTTIAVECENNTIFRIQKHIAQIARDCPEIAMWNADVCDTLSQDTAELGYDAAASDGWPAAPDGVATITLRC